MMKVFYKMTFSGEWVRIEEDIPHVEKGRHILVMFRLYFKKVFIKV